MSLKLDEFIGLPKSRATVTELLAWIKGNPGKPVVQNGRVVGKIYRHPDFGQTYITYRTSRHIYKKWGSIGVSRDIIVRLINEGVDTVIIILLDKKEGYITTPQKFLYAGRTFWFDSESDSQLHLPLSEMERL